MSTYKVTYYYLATGMEGIADIHSRGVVEATSAEEARQIVARREYPVEGEAYNFYLSCLDAEEVSLS